MKRTTLAVADCLVLAVAVPIIAVFMLAAGVLVALSYTSQWLERLGKA